MKKCRICQIRILQLLHTSITKSIDQTKNDSIKKINDIVESTSSKLDNSANTFEAMIADISIKSEEFGKLSSITPLYELVVETKREPARVLFSIHTLLQRFLVWLDNNPKQDKIPIENIHHFFYVMTVPHISSMKTLHLFNND
jgi:hypothetical protein